MATGIDRLAPQAEAPCGGTPELTMLCGLSHPMACYNLAWRRMRGLREPQADIVSLAERFRCLRLPGWPEAIAA
ncbi:MAG: hypothetical protein EA417_03805 [Gammaproteobacteria bacterium]|nr:MAG: hypothetical protein EA417_03805 [Gammaproteobacteria bacterium]